MRIGIDLDEVIANTLTAVINFHNEKYGTDFKENNFSSYRFWETWGGTRDEAIRKVHEFYVTDHFANVRPVAGSIDAVDKLKENGHELFIITGRQENIIKETEKWIKKHFPEVFSGVHFANTYGLTGSKMKKGTICEQLGIEIMVEDDIIYASELAESGIKVFLFDRPWNKDHAVGDNIERVSSWEDVVNKISRSK